MMYIHTTIATNLIHKDDIGIIFAQNINMAFQISLHIIDKEFENRFWY